MAVSLGYLASHSRNYESLLQTYRQINLTTQSVLLVLGTFLLSRIIETEALDRACFLEFLLIVLTVFSNIVMLKFQRVIRARGEDVNWWHTRIVRTEQSLPPEERIFTQFKIDQSNDRVGRDKINRFLDAESTVNESEIRELLDADIDHIRRVINTYILRGMRLIWLLIVIISIVTLCVR